MDTGSYMANQMSDLIDNSEYLIDKEYSKYKVLTVWQPYASLLIHGANKIETRPKPTTWTVEKGTYLIHAASKWTKEQAEICLIEPFRSELLDRCVLFRGIPLIYAVLNKEKDYITYKNWNIKLPLGQIIGSIEVTECIKINKILLSDFIEYPENSFGDYTPGRYAWLTQNPRVLKTPIPYKGGQGYYVPFKGDVNDLQFL